VPRAATLARLFSVKAFLCGRLGGRGGDIATIEASITPKNALVCANRWALAALERR
jgi:hypothetical protein